MSGTCQVHGQLHVRYLSGSCHPHVRSMSGTRTPPCQVHILSLPFTNPLFFLGGTKCPRSIGRDKVPSNQEFVSLCKGYVRSMSGTCTPPVRSRSLISGSTLRLSGAIFQKEPPKASINERFYKAFHGCLTRAMKALEALQNHH